MQVLVNSDHHASGAEAVAERVENMVFSAVNRFSTRITRVEVHMNDVNGPKHGEREKRCMMEARVGHVGAIAVTHQAATMAEAIEGAADRLERAIGHALARRRESAGPCPRDVEIASLEILQELERRERHH